MGLAASWKSGEILVSDKVIGLAVRSTKRSAARSSTLSIIAAVIASVVGLLLVVVSLYILFVEETFSLEILLIRLIIHTDP